MMCLLIQDGVWFEYLSSLERVFDQVSIDYTFECQYDDFVND